MEIPDFIEFDYREERGRWQFLSQEDAVVAAKHYESLNCGTSIEHIWNTYYNTVEHRFMPDRWIVHWWRIVATPRTKIRAHWFQEADEAVRYE